MVGANSVKYHGFINTDDIGKEIFTGWAQLEDYPYSCGYHTYRGPYFVKDALLHYPSLKFYPEQYSYSPGGCIDGAVRLATPPVGKCNSPMPYYFEATHAFEFAFNTAHLTKNGFRYWDTYGFMQRDFMIEYTEGLIEGWGQVVKHKPMKPARTTAFLSRCIDSEERYIDFGGMLNAYNISENSLGYMYESARLAGIPDGFTVIEESILDLSADMCDTLVLSTLKGADERVISKIRELYRDGVSLVALSDVSGLLNLFGVIEDKKEALTCRLCYGESEETVFNCKTEFSYKCGDARVLLWALDSEGGKHPLVIQKDRAYLINAPVSQIGHASYTELTAFSRENISELFRKATVSIMQKTSRSEIRADEKLGINRFYDIHGQELLLVTDYSDFDILKYSDASITYRVRLGEGYTEVETLYGKSPLKLCKDGKILELEFTLGYEESALLRLVK